MGHAYITMLAFSAILLLSRCVSVKRNFEILLLVNEGKLLLHTGTKSLKK